MHSEFKDGSATWGSFVIDDDDHCGYIRLAQKSRKSFELESTIEYCGPTGLEGVDRIPPTSLAAIRTVTPQMLPETDLASVPSPLRWFVGSYGIHTPAALIHDWLIGGDERVEGVTDADADRYFRFMLQDLGVRFIRRWLMWAAVALRTRFQSRGWPRLSIIIWVILAMIGTAGFIVTAATGQWLAMLALAAAPMPLSLLWGRQYGAGLLASYFAVPWVLPPTALASVFYGVYRLAEYLVKVVAGGFLGPRAGTEPADYQYF